jgi:predicted transcriptional regulator
VHADVKRLLALGLIERDENKRVFVPWTEIWIRLPLAPVSLRSRSPAIAA